MTQQNRETLLALADRAERATGGDRELDRAIADASYDIGFAIYGERVHYDPSLWLERYGPITSSLDAAMSLVPEGDLHLEIKHGKVWAFVGSPIRAATGATPALALCAAALRARATLDPTGEKA